MKLKNNFFFYNLSHFIYLILIKIINGTGVIQIESAKFGIQIGVGLVPIILFSIGFLLLLFFPLRGEKLVEIKKEIKKIYDKRLE